MGITGGSAGRRPTIRDVAATAGVSYQTVSRMLNGSPSIKESTRTRVLDAIAALGYSPNVAAQSLARGTSNAIGLLTMPTTDYGPLTAAIAIETAARDAGYRIVLTNAHSYAVDDIAASIDYLQAQQVAAIVIHVAVTSMFDALRRISIGVPYVTIEPTGLALGHSVAIDQAAGARLALEHLIGLGHRSIAHIRGPKESIDADARSSEYHDVMREIGASPTVVDGDWTAASGYAAGMTLLDAGMSSAVFAGNDQMALGVLHACRDRGVRVPTDFGVVGFDDVPEAAHFAPALTTVRQDFTALGHRAVEVLLESLGGGQSVVHQRIAPVLVTRDSATTSP